MRYFELIREASEQVWDYIRETYIELEHSLTNDPDAVLLQSENLEKRLLSMSGVDDDEQRLIDTAIESFQELIGRAHTIIARRDGITKPL